MRTRTLAATLTAVLALALVLAMSSVAFAVTLAPPTFPNPGMYTYNSPITLGWDAVSGATGYDYQLNGGSILHVTDPSTGNLALNLGANTLKVRSTADGGIASDWVTEVIIYGPNDSGLPAPVVSAPDTVYAPEVTVTWAPVAGADHYEYALNDATPVRVDGTSVHLAGLPAGDSSIDVRAVDQWDIPGDWGSAGVNYVVDVAGRTASDLTLEGRGKALCGQHVMFVARLTALGSKLNEEDIELQFSPDGVAWTTVDTQATHDDQPAIFSVRALRNGQYRASYGGSYEFIASTSAPRSLGVWVSMGRPTVNKRFLYANKPFSMTVAVAPPSAAGHVDMNVYQLRRGHWRAFKSFQMSSAAGSRVALFSGTSVRLSRGTFSLVAVYSGADFLTTSSATTVVVR